MFDTSQDLLNIVKAFCLLWVTIFSCWLIYYGAMILKSFYEITEKIGSTLNAVESFFSQAKNRLENVGQSLGSFLEIGKQVINYLGEKKASKANKKTKVKIN